MRFVRKGDETHHTLRERSCVRAFLRKDANKARGVSRHAQAGGWRL
jgi:hypothetical protein